MQIRNFHSSDIGACVNLLIQAYNQPPWNDHWTQETGSRYLSEFISNKNFIGYIITKSDELIGAMFAHRKTWWTNDEIFVDELFIKPDQQRNGYGKILINRVEQLSKKSGFGGVTLLTNKHHPAKMFYQKNGYTVADHVIFMYKEVK